MVSPPWRSNASSKPVALLLRPLLGVSGARLRATLEAEGRRGSKIPATTPSASSASACARRAQRSPASGSPTTRSRSAPAGSAARRQRSTPACALCSATRGLDTHAGAFASFSYAAWRAAPEELRLRLLARLIGAFGGQSEPLRLAPLEALVDRLAEPEFEGATLGGAIVCRHGEDVRVLREPGRAPLPAITLQPGGSAVWDGRFRVSAAPEAAAPVEVRALGAQGFAELRQQLDNAARIAGARRRHAAGVLAWRRVNHRSPVCPVDGVSPAWGTAARLYSAEFLG